MIKRIFLDLDDVLNVFTPYALQAAMRQINLDGREYNPAWGYDIVKAANTLPSNDPLDDGKEITAAQFWGFIDRSVWSHTPLSDEFHYLIHKSQEAVGKENVFILTTPTDCPESAAGKVEWIQACCPEWLHRQFLIGPPKWVCAHESLLFDDSDANIEAFRAAGGHTCLVPRPWNSRHAENSWCAIEHAFNLISTLNDRAGTKLRV